MSVEAWHSDICTPTNTEFEVTMNQFSLLLVDVFYLQLFVCSLTWLVDSFINEAERL